MLINLRYIVIDCGGLISILCSRSDKQNYSLRVGVSAVYTALC